MKIYFISNYFYPEIGAAPKRISEMASGLSRAGNKVEVVCPLPNYPYGKIFKEYRGRFFLIENYNGIILRRYRISSSVSRNIILRAWSMFSFAFNLLFEIWHLRKYRPDCIIIQNSPLFVSFVGIIISKITNRSKVVLNISDLWPLSALKLGFIKPGMLYNLLQCIERFNYLNSHFIIGQTNGIIQHATAIAPKASFLYRNFSAMRVDEREYIYTPGQFTIVYAGLLGVAQGVFDIVKNINFNSYGLKLHIYGDGNETTKIIEHILANPDYGIVYKGTLPYEELIKILPTYEAALVPLCAEIQEAAPSKMFEMAAAGVPLLYCSGGEGENIVKLYNLGLTSPPNNIKALSENITRISSMPINEYLLLRQSCRNASKKYFNFDKQMQAFINRLNELVI
jgi:glycosyltransferase involved in cell wall biosynthesis